MQTLNPQQQQQQTGVCQCHSVCLQGCWLVPCPFPAHAPLHGPHLRRGPCPAPCPAGPCCQQAGGQHHHHHARGGCCCGSCWWHHLLQHCWAAAQNAPSLTHARLTGTCPRDRPTSCHRGQSSCCGSCSCCACCCCVGRTSRYPARPAGGCLGCGSGYVSVTTQPACCQGTTQHHHQHAHGCGCGAVGAWRSCCVRGRTAGPGCSPHPCYSRHPGCSPCLCCLPCPLQGCCCGAGPCWVVGPCHALGCCCGGGTPYAHLYCHLSCCCGP